jgi:Flp pilus assembly protein TadG
MSGTFRSFWRDRSGVVSLETGMVLAFILVPLLLGSWDCGQIIQSKGKADEAIRAAIAYVEANPAQASNATAIQNAATASVGAANISSFTASNVCYCVASGSNSIAGLSPASSCSASCSGTIYSYASVVASTTVNLLFPVPFSGSSFTLSSNGMLRVQ